MRKEEYMQKTAEELVDFLIDVLNDYKGFGNWWHDIEDEDQDALKEEVAEELQGFLDDEE
jgi:hypothetical protein